MTLWGRCPALIPLIHLITSSEQGIGHWALDDLFSVVVVAIALLVSSLMLRRLSLFLPFLAL